jgi:hypothetical protein
MTMNPVVLYRETKKEVEQNVSINQSLAKSNEREDTESFLCPGV